MGAYQDVPLQFSKRGRRNTAKALTFIAGGFTLLEVLVVIAVIALLVGLVTTSLFHSRAGARFTKSSINVKTLYSVVIEYCDVHKETFPVTEDNVFYPSESRYALLSLPYWDINRTWTGVVYDLFPFDENKHVFLSPGSPRLRFGVQSWPSSYQLSTSIAGVPELWSGTATANPFFRVAMRISAVRFPSSKAILWDVEAAFAGANPRRQGGNLAVATPTAMVDGSVLSRVGTSASDAVPNPFANSFRFERLHNTRDGVLGRDY